MGFPVVLPERFLQKALKLRVFAEDIEEKFIRGSGKGGQKINKTSSTVLLKHIPSGTEVRCQKHREQSSNRVSAYKLLILKIEDQVLGAKSERAQKIFKLKKQKQRRSRRSKEKILADKKLRGEVKQARKKVTGSDGRFQTHR